VNVEFDEMPLRDALAALAKQAGVPIGLDFRSLEVADVDVKTPVTFVLKGRPLAVALDRMLDPLDMTFVIRGCRLVATTRDAAAEMRSVAFYPFGPDTDRQGRANWPGLVDAIEATVTPDNWMSVGGASMIRVIDGDVPGLVISHTTAGHRAVDAFLTAIPKGATIK